jgi:transcriptional regulator with XRE-family HTH domain
MTPQELTTARRNARLTQVQAAARLGVSQPYLSQLERGLRPVTPALARAAARAFRLRATALPLPSTPKPRDRTTGWLVRQLSALGYPGYAHLRRAGRRVNPAHLLLEALSQDNLDSRAAATLPWVLLRHPDLDWDWLVSNLKLRNLQNRLGFLVAVARQVAERQPQWSRSASALEAPEEELERARLAAETTLCREGMPAAERRWLAGHRTELARHWNVLTSLTPESLPYAA